MFDALPEEWQADIEKGYWEDHQRAEFELRKEYGDLWPRDAPEGDIARKRKWLEDRLSRHFWSAIHSQREKVPALKLEVTIEGRLKQLAELRQVNCEAQANAAECAWRVEQLEKKIARLNEEAAELHKENRAKQRAQPASTRRKQENPASELEAMIESRQKQLAEARQGNCGAQAKAADCAWRVEELEKEIARLNEEAAELHKENRVKQRAQRANDRSGFSLSVNDRLNAFKSGVKSGAQSTVQRSKNILTGLSKAVANVHVGSGAGIHGSYGAAAPGIVSVP
ncbi:MAG: hypothetical protein M1816_003693 [Peltula sp. TS41687]|nr:MAG: hypothetical protein M1816_003693 [Peltula sp. TS41687]